MCYYLFMKLISAKEAAAMGRTGSDTREGWLKQAGLILRNQLVKGQAGLELPNYHVSVGFPRGSRGRQRAIGQCWSGAAAKDGHANIFVCPTQGDAVRVLDILLHELLHAATPGAGHKGAFVKAAKAVGLLKPWTATTAGEVLREQLVRIAAQLGPYPHGAMSVGSDRPKPGSRLRLWECECGIKVRVGRDEFNATCGECDSAFVKQG